MKFAQHLHKQEMVSQIQFPVISKLRLSKNYININFLRWPFEFR